MAFPLFLNQNNRRKIYKKRTYLERLSNTEVRQYTGMDWRGVRDIFDWISPHMEMQTDRNHSIDSEVRVLTALSFLRSGTFQWQLGGSSGVSQASCSRIIEKFCNVVIREGYGQIRFPQNRLTLERSKENFSRIAGLPNIIGCIDGTQIEIIGAMRDEHIYVNRHLKHSINVQVVSDADLKLIDVVAKYPGSTHDSFIWRNCGLRTKFQNGHYGTGILLGDSGYPNDAYLNIPITRAFNQYQERYNTAHKETRCTVERAIGTWKSRFRSIHMTGGALSYRPEKVCKIIISTAILHNFCRDHQINLLEPDVEYLEEVLLPIIQYENDNDNEN